MTNAEIKAWIDSLTATEDDEKEVIYQQLGNAKMVIGELLDIIGKAKEHVDNLTDRNHQLELTLQDTNNKAIDAEKKLEVLQAKVNAFKQAYDNLME